MTSTSRQKVFFPRFVAVLLVGLTTLAMSTVRARAEDAPLRDRLKATGYKIAYECYVDGNWEIFVSNADGTGAVNLTKTPNVNEHYPQISPDSTRVCFSVDEGEGKTNVRSLWIMNIDGSDRKKIADHAREPFWSRDGKTIGFLGQEYPKFNVVDFYTKGMNFYDVASGKITPHVNTANLRHLYNPSFSPNGKWIAATVHAGMGVGHAILLIEANGDRVINLGIPGCRPCISPDGAHIAWGAGDHELATAKIDLNSENPSIEKWNVVVKDDVNKVYHIDWSPDGKYVAFSRGPDGEGDLSKPGTYGAACEIVGVFAGNWNIYVVSAEGKSPIDLNHCSPDDFVQITTNGASNKEPAWFAPAETRK